MHNNNFLTGLKTNISDLYTILTVTTKPFAMLFYTLYNNFQHILKISFNIDYDNKIYQNCNFSGCFTSLLLIFFSVSQKLTTHIIHHE